jgi:hypothetical protein
MSNLIEFDILYGFVRFSDSCESKFKTNYYGRISIHCLGRHFSVWTIKTVTFLVTISIQYSNLQNMS